MERPAGLRPCRAPPGRMDHPQTQSRKWKPRGYGPRMVHQTPRFVFAPGASAPRRAPGVFKKKWRRAMPPAPHIVTISGRKVYPFAPHADQIDPMDIAHSLSLLNRFNGHTSQPYSVGQHSPFCGRDPGHGGRERRGPDLGAFARRGRGLSGRCDFAPERPAGLQHVAFRGRFQGSRGQPANGHRRKIRPVLAHAPGREKGGPNRPGQRDHGASAGHPGKLDGLPEHPLPSGLGDWPFYQWHQVRDLLFARLQVHLERIAA